ncbi:methylation-associated defense system DNA methyltransferase MAD2 [Thermomonospora umbrina]|uniref:Type I restriction enzyme M protein n=1 Tax=Thermomonospora umbrina TaxID=111806 RepID=A0A3D9SIM6_9ACTN|nr:N-6 DNA methylase [Thermomonospora umbrina]REE95759.1 type I restriction enzyme M protein [Thermomonospora umbrina]
MEQMGLDMGDLGEATQSVEGVPDSLADDEIIDFITGERVKDKGSEPVRQRVARALFHEYGISVADMRRDFPIPVASVGRRKATKKADIAIFTHGAPHDLANLRRVVICKPEPKASRKVTKIRTFNQASEDLEELEELLGTEKTPQAQYGMWTNGVDFFFLYKESTRFGARFEQRADWPIADESVQSGSVVSVARLRRGEAAMLKTAFQRCHNYIHGNEGMPKDAAFWQFLYLLFAKMHDERVSRQARRAPEFYALPSEPFNEEGRKAIRKRIEALFADVKKEYPLFTARDEISLSDRALAFIVGELAPYDLMGTDIDVKGMAYQELLGSNLRGDRGQYFTPIGAVELTVAILDPQEDETVFDPACGTGGFLRETLRHLLNKWRAEEKTIGLPDTEEQLIDHQGRLRTFADEHLFGADFDPFLVRATSMSIMTLTGGEGNLYNMDSLAFPRGHLSGVAAAEERIPLGSVDVLMTNPPFGTDIKIEDKDVLAQYRDGVGRSWTRNKATGKTDPGEPRSAVPPEQLFIQRAVDWVRPGGLIGIVLPNGILSNPGPVDEGIREWILEHCWVLASVELPVETFIYDAGVNILTSLLFLKKKTENEKLKATMAGGQPDYPVFMAVAEKVGIDRRGNPVYKRQPDGEVVLEVIEERERIRRDGGDEVTILHRKRKAIDNDLPEIAEAYKRFRLQHEEPGEPRRPNR